MTLPESGTPPSPGARGRSGGWADVLTGPVFLAALALLILNDAYLKAAFGNTLTGKLSDVAGLAAFALFWAAFLPRWRRTVFVATAAAFALWKSPVSQPALDAWNAVAPWRWDRAVDYTDWVALLVLIPVYRAPALREGAGSPGPAAGLRRRLAAVAVGALAIIAFTATSILPPPPEYVDPVSWPVSGSIADVRAGLDTLGITTELLSRRAYAPPAEDRVTVLLYIRQPPERPVAVSVRLWHAEPGRTEMVLLGARALGPGSPLQREAVHRAFAEQVYEPLMELLGAGRR